MTDYNNPLGGPSSMARGTPITPVFSFFSIVAIIAAVIAITNALGGFASFICAIAAIVLGGLGMLEAILPSRRGGIVSFFAILAGLLGIAVGLFRLLGTAAHHV